jgi:site-specific DNA-methyltransferase (adenine-specific)
MSDEIDDWTGKVHHADALEALAEIPSNALHAVVCDPPYALAFMGRDWDSFDPKEYQAWCEEWATLALDALKPGGHLLAFSGNRTHHRLFSGVQDAGFELRDTVTWHYGSGFPKALDVSKAIGKQRGKDDQREVIHTRKDSDITGENVATEGAKDTDESVEYDITAPATDAAERWDGFKTALKPATEFVCVARAPFDGTVAENVQEHGTAALNIDATRVGTDPEGGHWPGSDDNVDDEKLYGDSRTGGDRDTAGRYPSNVVFGERAADQLDRDVGELEAGASREKNHGAASGGSYGEYDTQDHSRRNEFDSGGPSRYFYTSKASRAERTHDGKIENDHPTVKPVDLMEWLVKLVTAEDQIVCDPFAGSGTTLLAAKNKQRRFVGVEQDEGHVSLAQARVGLAPDDPEQIRDDDATGLEQFATDGGEE